MVGTSINDYVNKTNLMVFSITGAPLWRNLIYPAYLVPHSKYLNWVKSEIISPKRNKYIT